MLAVSLPDDASNRAGFGQKSASASSKGHIPTVDLLSDEDHVASAVHDLSDSQHEEDLEMVEDEQSKFEADVCLDVGAMLNRFTDIEAMNVVADDMRISFDAAEIIASTDNPFSAAAKNSADAKRKAWAIYQRFFIQQVKRPHERECDVIVAHPPSREIWLGFLVHAKSITSSFDRTNCLVQVVCGVGDAHCRVAARQSGSVWTGRSPIKEYKADHNKVMHHLQRGSHTGVRSFLGITMQEALSYPLFADESSNRGLMDSAIFGYGCISIKRARSLTSMLLRHVRMRAVEVCVTGSETSILVAEMCFESWDEKTFDKQGVRSVSDKLDSCNDYDMRGVLGPSYWLYKLFVIRGVLVGGDPLLTARHGDILSFNSLNCSQYVFCAVDHVTDDLCGYEPNSVQMLSDSTRRVLNSMGCPERGVSAHQKGGATRAIINALLKSKGMEISSALENTMLRWGGWSQKSGLITLRTVYQQSVLDLNIDRYSLSFVLVLPDFIWEKSVEEYRRLLVCSLDHPKFVSPHIVVPCHSDACLM